MADVFLSYAQADAERAAVVARQIEAAGFGAWWDDRLRSGRFAEEIEVEIAQAKCIVVLWSRHTADSDWVPAEADRGRVGCKLVQVRLDPDCRIPLPFDWLHVLDLTDWPIADGTPQIERVLEAIRDEVEQSALVRRLRRLWRPASPPKLRAWDVFLAAALLVLFASVLGAWATGYLSHEELALYGSGVFLAWALWLMVKAFLTRWLAGLSIAPRRLATGLLASLVLAAGWTTALVATYAVPEFPEGVSGLLVARFEGDRWNRERDRLSERLFDKIDEWHLAGELAVDVVDRRPRPSNQMALLESANASLLLKRPAWQEPGGARHRIVFRKSPGIFATTGGLRLTDAVESVPVQVDEREAATISALLDFLAGYTHYRNGEYARAEKRLAAAVDATAPSAPAAGADLADRRGIVSSLSGSAAFFLGNCLALDARVADALKMYDRALAATNLRKEPLFVEAVSNKAVLLIETRRYEEARSTLETAAPLCDSLDRKIGCAYLHYNLGATAALLGDFSSARRAFESAARYAQEGGDEKVPDAERASLETFIRQKWSWAIAKQLETGILADTAPESGEVDLAEARAHLVEAETAWRSFANRPLLPQIQVTKARLSIIAGDAPSALSILEGLDTQELAKGEPEVHLLLAIARLCSGKPSGDALGEFAQSVANPLSGLLYYRHWSHQCSPD